METGEIRAIDSTPLPLGACAVLVCGEEARTDAQLQPNAATVKILNNADFYLTQDYTDVDDFFLS